MTDWLGQIITEVGSGNVSFIVSAVINIVIIVLLGFFTAKLSVEILKRLLRIQAIRSSLKKTGYRMGIEKLLTSILKYSIYFFVAIAVLSQIGLSNFVIQLITVTLILIVLLVLGLGLEGVFPNLYAGVYIKKSKMIKKGDNVRVKNINGIVEKVDLVETTIKTKSGVVVIPNSTVVKGGVVKKNV